MLELINYLINYWFFGPSWVEFFNLHMSFLSSTICFVPNFLSRGRWEWKLNKVLEHKNKGWQRYDNHGKHKFFFFFFFKDKNICRIATPSNLNDYARALFGYYIKEKKMIWKLFFQFFFSWLFFLLILSFFL
jgi:hypothetical protein